VFRQASRDCNSSQQNLLKKRRGVTTYLALAIFASTYLLIASQKIPFQNRRAAHPALHRDGRANLGVIRAARHLMPIVRIYTSCLNRIFMRETGRRK
jgi:hypothetical protein